MENQEVIFRLSMMEQQMNQLQQQMQAIEKGINELERLSINIDELKNSHGKEIFAQIGRGIYAKAKLVSEELTVNVGENTFVKKTIPEAKELIEEQIKKLKDAEAELEASIESANSEFLMLIQEYQRNEKIK